MHELTTNDEPVRNILERPLEAIGNLVVAAYEAQEAILSFRGSKMYGGFIQHVRKEAQKSNASFGAILRAATEDGPQAKLRERFYGRLGGDAQERYDDLQNKLQSFRLAAQDAAKAIKEAGPAASHLRKAYERLLEEEVRDLRDTGRGVYDGQGMVSDRALEMGRAAMKTLTARRAPGPAMQPGLQAAPTASVQMGIGMSVGPKAPGGTGGTMQVTRRKAPAALPPPDKGEDG